MDKAKKTKIKRLVALGVAAVVVLLLACMPLLAKNKEAKDGPQASILSGTVTTGTIKNTLIGGGTLSQDGAEEITVPAGVKLTKFLVSNGEAVTAGQAIAGVDRVSVMDAISQVQETLEYLTGEIEAVSDSALSSKVTAQAGGTVKQIFAQKGDDVQSVLLEQGALVVLSLDDRMCVTVETEAQVSAGDGATLTLSGGKTVSGTVESSLMGTVKILTEDKGYTPGQTVTVAVGETELGAGTLEINSPWKATAIAGAVEKVKVSVGDTVDAGDTLMTLSGTGHVAAWQQLVDQHGQYEQMMLELFQMYQSQTVTAPCDGVITGVDAESAQLLKAARGGTLQLLANAPNGNDQILYTNYIGKVAAVAQNGWAVLLNPQAQKVEDYKALGGVNVDTAAMTDVAVYPVSETAAPLFELSEGQWVQGDLKSVQAGDILLFAGDDQGNFVWMVRIQKAEGQTPSQPQTPSGGQQTPGQQLPSQNQGQSQMQGQFPGGNMGSQFPQEEEEFEVYATDTVLIASVIPQQEMTLDITVDELDVLCLQVGQAAQITVDALSGEVFEGTISQIGNTGTSNGGNSKFTVTLTMERTGDMLSGMNATATIPLDSYENVLTVPVAAVAQLGTKSVIYTGYDEKNETLTDPVAVTLGVSDGETVQVLSGLNEADAYYYAYYDTLEVSAAPDFGSGGFFGR